MNDLRERYDFLFDGSGDLTQETLLLYVFGPLENEARQAVEQHLAECEMCRDAAEGIALLGTKEQALSILALTDAKLTERVDALKQKVTRDGKEALINQTAAVEPTKTKKPERRIGWYRYAAAASVILVVGVAFWMFNQNMVLESQDLAMNKEDSLGLFKESEQDKGVFETTQNSDKDPLSNDTGMPTTNEPMEPEGTVSSTDSGGGAGYTFQWESGTGTVNTGTSAGTYSVSVNDDIETDAKLKEDNADVAAQKPSAPTTSAPAPPKKQKDAPPAPDLIVTDEELEDVVAFEDANNVTLRSAPTNGRLNNGNTDSVTLNVVAGAGSTTTFAESEPPITLDKGTSNSNFTLNNAANMTLTDASVNQAQYPGGMAEVQKYFDKATYPASTKKGYKGVIVLELSFDEKGKITKSTIIRGLGNPYDVVILDHVKKMPNWEAPAPYGEPFASTRVITVEVTVR